MCNLTGIAFGETVLTEAMIAGRDVLEVGAADVNGSLRPFVESLKPRRYVGVDVAPGPSVDEVLDASKLVDRFGAESFDVVVTTEMIEHVRDWRTVIGNLKRVVRPGGLLLVTTRSIGFPYHGYPYDFWRYELDDMRAIFADFEIVALEPDTDTPGVFMLAHKPAEFVEKTTSVALYSIVLERRSPEISTVALLRFRAGRILQRRLIHPVWDRLPGPVRSGTRRVLQLVRRSTDRGRR